MMMMSLILAPPLHIISLFHTNLNAHDDEDDAHDDDAHKNDDDDIYIYVMTECISVSEWVTEN